MKRRAEKTVIYILLILFAVMIIIPLIWVVITGFKTNQELFLATWSLPEEWKFENYIKAWDSGIGVYLKNSVIVTVCGTALATFVSCLAAYPLSRMNFSAKKTIVLLIMGGLMLAPQSSVISLYRMARAMHLYDTLTGLILINAAFRIPFSTFLIMTFYKGISKSLDESAIIDGAKTRQIFWKIMMPLSKPIIASSAIVCVRAIWNELMFANVMITSNAKKTIPVGLVNMQGMTTTNWTVLMAGMVISSLPLIIIFLLLQKQFIRGLTAGSVKG